MSLQALSIIRLYDDVIASVYGENMRRLFPHNTDLQTAQRWLDAGANINQIKTVLTKALEKRFIRNQTIPFSLRYFDQSMRDAIATRAYLEKQDDLTPEESQWKARINGFLKGYRWLDMWGPRPDEPGCMCPSFLLPKKTPGCATSGPGEIKNSRSVMAAP